MTFTDDDLKRLKEVWDIGETPKHSSWQRNSMTAKYLEALIARMEAAEALIEDVAHEDDCIRTFNSAGEPTPDGGYRMKFKDKWYQARPIDDTPKCDCGLDELYEAWRKAAGK